MGMYDTIHYHSSLPDGRTLKDGEFQTKSLACVLDHYTITEDGQLIRHENYQQPFRIDQGIKIPVHGDIFLHALDGKEYIECVARFTHGRLEYLKMLKDCSDDERIMYNLSD